jgi:hypothetical protein
MSDDCGKTKVGLIVGAGGRVETGGLVGVVVGVWAPTGSIRIPRKRIPLNNIMENFEKRFFIFIPMKTIRIFYFSPAIG